MLASALSRSLRQRTPAGLVAAASRVVVPTARTYSTALEYLEPVTSLMEEEAMMRDAANKFAQEVVAPRALAMDDAGAMEPEVIQGLFDAGFMGVEIAEKYNGCGSSFTSALLVIEELARADPAVSVMVDIHNTIVNNCVSNWASDPIKDTWLPRLATDTLGAFALSESGSGSDAFALKSTAERVGDEFVLNGEKMWISNSAEAGVFLVMANANPVSARRLRTCIHVTRPRSSC